jgi:outer membrane receptor for ferrienterochelin and colicin
MKNLLRISLLFALICVASGCASTEDYNRKARDFSQYATLAEAIRSVGGVVTGGNTLAGVNQAVISLRGQSSIILNTQPLYVVDNVPIGNSYNTANNLVHPSNIVSIRIIRGSSGSTIYGEDANSGVIIIRTKDYKAKRGGPTG